MEETTRRRHRPSNTGTTRSEIDTGRPVDNDYHHDAAATATARRKRKRRRRKRPGDDDPPFAVLVLQVGTVLFLLSVMTYHIYLFLYPTSSTNASTYSGDDDDMQQQQDVLAGYDQENLKEGNGDTKDMNEQQAQPKLSELLHNADNDNKPQKRDTPKKVIKTAPPLPHFNLSSFSQWDAFGVSEKLLLPLSHTDHTTSIDHPNEFWNATTSLKHLFSRLYGGENAARMLLDQGLSTFRDATTTIENAPHDATTTSFPPDIVATACRLHHAKQEQRPFRMAFGGYSVTTGRGNRHGDSYPFQIQRILEPLAKLAGIPSIDVHNAAIGGCPSFPYGFCMAQFWGVASSNSNTTSMASPDNSSDVIHTPDVVSWEFGMNEATGGSEGLEAYVRQILSTYSSSAKEDTAESHDTLLTSPPPKLIVKDHSTAIHRKQLLAEYADLLQDPVVIHTDEAVQVFLDREEEFRPPGFQRWREFGAPHGAPGQAYHHPAVQEHKLNGWLLAMHFVTALEYMVSKTSKQNDNGSWCPNAFQDTDLSNKNTKPSSQVLLPPPASGRIMNVTNLHYDSFLFGRPLGNTKTVDQHPEQLWVMDPIQCRTSFQPKISGDLTEIVVSGTIAEDLEVTLPKSQFYYNKGWTFDLSESEKGAKRKLSLYPDSLGFKDSKEAYYGIYESGTMSLLLPFETTTKDDTAPKVGDTASKWFDSIILCQVNEKTYEEHPDACNFATDVSYRVGSANVTSNHTKMVHTIGAVYLGRPICKHVKVPLDARLTSHNQLLIEDEKATHWLEHDQVGLLVEIFVSNPSIVHVHQACSISHVVWQERQS